MLATRLNLSKVCTCVRPAFVVAKPVRVEHVRKVSAFEGDDNSFIYGEGESSSVAMAMDPAEEEIPLPTYNLNVLYLEKCIGLAIDQQLASGERAPVTEYFMWPSKDAWDQLKTQLESMPWISQTESIHLLNNATQIINFWQDEEVKHTMDEATLEFPDVTFLGA